MEHMGTVIPAMFKMDFNSTDFFVNSFCFVLLKTKAQKNWSIFWLAKEVLVGMKTQTGWNTLRMYVVECVCVCVYSYSGENTQNNTRHKKQCMPKIDIWNHLAIQMEINKIGKTIKARRIHSRNMDTSFRIEGKLCSSIDKSQG